LRREVFDAAGRRVALLLDEERPAGPGTLRWNGRDAAGRSVASGVYHARLRAAGKTQTTKLVLVR